jgi:hypothetical protein
MTREHQAAMKSWRFRVAGNVLIFNKLWKLETGQTPATLAVASRFAQACPVLLSKQHVERVEHRPATRPGAD